MLFAGRGSSRPFLFAPFACETSEASENQNRFSGELKIKIVFSPKSNLQIKKTVVSL